MSEEKSPVHTMHRAESCTVNVLINKCFPSSTVKQEVVITSGRVIPLVSSHSSLSAHMHTHTKGRRPQHWNYLQGSLPNRNTNFLTFLIIYMTFAICKKNQNQKRMKILMQVYFSENTTTTYKIASLLPFPYTGVDQRYITNSWGNWQKWTANKSQSITEVGKKNNEET